MKLTPDSRWRKPLTMNEYHDAYGCNFEFGVFALKLLSEGKPTSRPRVIFRAAKSKGNPKRLFRTPSVTNSSISFPRWADIP